MTEDQKIQELLRRLKEDGVATAKVHDGQVFLFAKERLRELLEKAEAEGAESVSVLVKSPEGLN